MKGGPALRDLRFRYDAMEPLVLDGVNLDVKAGEHIAILGRRRRQFDATQSHVPGGSKKWAKFCRPAAAQGFVAQNFRERVAVVLQDVMLFAGSVAENIALFDDTPDMTGWSNPR